MAGSAEPAATKTANLARIRDNQRRSRARRKEYLQELEIKYRNCEQVGVTASAEIQAAARRVIDENKRLRQLLKAKGVSEIEIEHATAADAHSLTASGALETTLNERRPCSPGDNMVGNAGCGPRDCRTGCGPMPQQPHSAPASRKQSFSLHSSENAGTPIPQHVSAEHSQYPSPVSSISTGPFAPQPPPQHQAIFTMAEPLLLPPAGMNMPQQEDFDWMNGFVDQHYWPPMSEQDLTGNGMGPYQAQDDSYAMPEQSGTSSCQIAATTLRTFKPEAGCEVEAELGCRAGEECQVANDKIFGLMDRYGA